MFEGKPDPLAPHVAQARAAGWHLVPQVGSGEVEHALLRGHDHGFYALTLPWIGPATVVSVMGGVNAERPRDVGDERWRHRVSPEAAIAWALRSQDGQDFHGDDRMLLDYLRDEGLDHG
ncbi:MAG: hypothetical protein ACRDRH_21445 [Pseudonocardia sp.]